ncbi:MAG: hypothetical protein WCW33_04125 [Candidatus Babeliales bacterium]|jgi:hypothetical protein
MLDTIVLTLAEESYAILEPQKFTVCVRGGGFSSLRQNPVKNERHYKPRLTQTTCTKHIGGAFTILKIELSLPKLIFGNNFDELQQEDFDRVVEKLRITLEDMGVKIDTQALKKAAVSTIHYSKNIPFTDGSRPYHYITKIQEANTKLSLDVNKTDYRNDGHSYKWHCNSYEVVFYDKIKDLEMAKKSIKRAVENEHELVPALLRELQRNEKLEVLRMEVRLNKPQKIRQLSQKLGINGELTFQNLFNAAIAQKVLLHYLDEIDRQRPAIVDYEDAEMEKFLVDLITSNPELGPSQILKIVGIKKVLDSVGPRALRGMFGRSGQRNIDRLIAETKKIRLPKRRNPLGVIREHLINFVPLKMISF